MMCLRRVLMTVLLAGGLLVGWCRQGRAATPPDAPPKAAPQVGAPAKSAPRPDEKEDDKKAPEPTTKTPAGTKAAPKRPTTIRDALTFDPNLYGVDFSKSKLGEANDVITRDALRGSSRIALEDGKQQEAEQIVEDRHAAKYEQAVKEEQTKAEDEAKDRAKEADRRVEETKRKRPWVLVGAGVAVLLALALMFYAIRKMQSYD